MIYIIALCIGSGLAYLANKLRRDHLKQRARERVCKCRTRDGRLCGKPTIRRHQMIVPPRSCERVGIWSKLFRAVTFDECPDGHVKLINAVLKRYTLPKLVWRHMRDPQQFITDETLFERAGLIDQVQPNLITRMDRKTAPRERGKIQPHLPRNLPSAHFVAPKRF